MAATAAGEGPILVGAWVDEMAGAIASGGVRTMIVMPSVAATMAAAGGTEAAAAAITCAEGPVMVAGTVTGATGIGSVIATGTGSGTGEAETAVDGVGQRGQGCGGDLGTWNHCEPGHVATEYHPLVFRRRQRAVVF